MDELALWDAVETAKRIRGGEISRAEVVDAAILRAEAKASLGALVTPAFERARSTRLSGPFAGVPTALKDLAQLAGVDTGWGSASARPYRSKRSDPFVRRFERTGVAILGKSATPEYGLTGTTEPLGAAPCRNPWNSTHTAGGSSGGAASLVAAGVVPIAHGSDGGGSIRIPASCCGLVGLKVSRGVCDMEGSPLLPINVAVHGCLSRTVRDTRAFWTAMGASFRPRAGALRVALVTHSSVGRVEAANERAAKAAGALCEDLGHHVESIDYPFDASLNGDFLRFWGLIAWIQKVGGKVLVHRGFDATKLEPWTQAMATHGSERPRETVAAITRLRRFRAAYDALFERFDVLLHPTLASAAPRLGYLATDLPFETAFRRLRRFSPFAFLANVAGTPAISLPLGCSESGLPVGVQFSGARGSEGMLLDLAESIENAAPWPRTAPHNPPSS